ncbi:hypothetical protein REPUB_Repub12eG0074500 [Reevesia pubescens]
MAIQAKPPTLFCHLFQCSLHSPTASQSLVFGGSFKSRAQRRLCRKPLRIRSNANDPQDDYLIDAPISAGDGFSFSGGKYSDEPTPSHEWFKQGKFVKAHPVGGTGKKAKDPIFGLTMGAGSQASNDVFRWFCVESGNADNPTVILIHGFPSQAYSYRKILPVLSKNYRAIAFDWLAKHANLPSTLSIFSNFLLVEIFSQDPLRASDKALTSCGPYAIKEDDAMVYRRPYLTSGSSGFALNAISRAMNKELKAYVEDMKVILMDKNWKFSNYGLLGPEGSQDIMYRRIVVKNLEESYLELSVEGSLHDMFIYVTIVFELSKH